MLIAASAVPPEAHVIAARTDVSNTDAHVLRPFPPEIRRVLLHARRAFRRIDKADVADIALPVDGGKEPVKKFSRAECRKDHCGPRTSNGDQHSRRLALGLESGREMAPGAPQHRQVDRAAAEEEDTGARLHAERGQAVRRGLRRPSPRSSYCVMLTLGLRLGEALGLKWEDLDLDSDRGTVFVQRRCSEWNCATTPLHCDSSNPTVTPVIASSRFRRVSCRCLSGIGPHKIANAWWPGHAGRRPVCSLPPPSGRRR